MSTQPSRTSKSKGQIRSTIGSAEASLGDVVGAQGFAAAGRDRHDRGQAELGGARTQGYVGGTADRAAGKKDAVVGAASGDPTQQAQGNIRNEQGQAEQQWNS